MKDKVRCMLAVIEPVESIAADLLLFTASGCDTGDTPFDFIDMSTA
jgi:hypothetical protein